jgi:hypothetical protein
MKEKEIDVHVKSLEIHQSLKKRIAELKAENEKLRELNEILKRTLCLTNPKINIMQLKKRKVKRNENR